MGGKSAPAPGDISRQTGGGDAQAAELAAGVPGARSPFRLVIHFTRMADRFRERIRGGAGRDFLHGKPKTGEHFDADAGGDDILFGMSGDDVYWLGPGTGKDTIVEVAGDTGNVIRLEKDPAAHDVRLVADARHLHVALVDDKGEETDRHTVVDHFGRGTGIARVELPDGKALFDSADFNAAWLSFVSGTLVFPPVAPGGPGPEEDGITRVWEENRFVWTGSSRAGDSFLPGDDSLRAPDDYRGRGGNDIYWLGIDTGHDRVYEHEDNPQGDPGDAIVVKSGISAPGPGLVTDLDRAVPMAGDGPVAWVHRSPNGRDLVVAVVERQSDGGHRTLASLAVDRFFVRDNAQVEKIVFADDPSATLSLKDLRGAAIVGWSVDDDLEGGPGPDVFDGSAGGDDRLYGYGGDDTYHLGPGTGTDTVFEHHRNARGDGGDRVVVKEGVRIPKVDGIWRVAGGQEPTLRVRRSDDGGDLRVEVTAGGEVVAALIVDSHYVKPNARVEGIRDAHGRVVMSEGELKEARITGDKGDNLLYGRDGDDHFDISAGGADTLHGYAGSDTYWLGSDGGGTGTIREWWGNRDGFGDIDVIRLKEDLSAAGTDGRRRSLRVWRSDDGRDLHVALLVDGTVGSAYVVEGQYRLGHANLEVERILSVDGEIIHDEASLPSVRIIGDGGDNILRGSAYLDDHFDISAGGDDNLYGYAGSDVYWLGSAGGGTGTIRESVREWWETGPRTPGDIDVIRLKEDLSAAGADGRRRSLRVWRSDDGRDLHVALLADGKVGGAYIVEDHYWVGRDSPEIERILSVGGEVVHDEASLARARIVGDGGDNVLRGSTYSDDHFDISAGGADILYGSGGSDVYWLGSDGGGAGTIREWARLVGEGGSRARGDIDVIRLKEDLSAAGDGGRRRSLRVWRSDDGRDLHVALLVDGAVGGAYVVDNHYWVGRADSEIERILSVGGEVIHDEASLARVRIVGDAGDNVLRGSTYSDDHFDISAGGADILHGYSGSDVYWLGSDGGGTGTIREWVGKWWESGSRDRGDVDVIRLKEDLSVAGEDGDRRSLRVWRSDDGRDLHVALLVGGAVGGEYVVEDHYWVGRGNSGIERILSVGGEVIHDEASLARARIVGDAGDNLLVGSAYSDDHFDISAGGNDILHGYNGSDVYWLGSDGGGTGTIRDFPAWDQNMPDNSGDTDVIRLKEDVSAVGEDGRRRSLEVWRSDDGHDLHVALLVDGEVGGEYVVEDHYRLSDEKIEAVLSVDGRVIHDADALAKARIVGGAGDDRLRGTDLTDDHFDGSRGGSDHLYGYGGDDVYWLDRGTGHDSVHEYHQSGRGDSGDAIRIVSRHIRRSDVDVAREGDNLVVSLLGGDGTPTDSITVVRHFSDKAARVESIELNGRTLLVRDLVAAIDAIAGFNVGGSRGATLDLAPDSVWRDPSDLLGGPAT